MRQLSALGLALLTLVPLAAVPPPARAQDIEVPTFVVAPSAAFGDHIQDVDVAVGTDGTIVFIWGEYTSSIASNLAVTRRFSAAGQPLGPAVRADSSKHVFGPVISSDTRGAYVAAWQWIRSGQEYSFFGQVLDAAGARARDDFKVDFANSGPTSSGAVAGLPSGSVFVWKQLANKLWGRLYDPAGEPRGAAFEIGPAGAGFDQDVAALPDGGFVAAWTNSWLDTFSWARVYGPGGEPRGPVFTIGPADFYVHRVAASPLGGLAAAGARWNGETSEPWLVRFTEDGETLGSHRIEVPPPGVSVKSDLGFDPGGNAYVVWSEYQPNGDGVRPPRARGFDPAGNPAAPGFWPTTEKANEIRADVLPNGSFVNVWYRSGKVSANIVSILPPGTVVCGDGVPVPGYEECDDGAANSDQAPDACRTNCLRARCGDGVTDSPEQCDDGNSTGCDGCSATCQLEPGPVCGDGIVSPGCEQCDDGNQTWGDGCSGVCRLERIPGGGSPVSDCLSAWAINNPANSPRYDKAGAINYKQTCRDNDPRCDFDGGAAGGCAFHLRVCVNNTGAWRCTPAPLASWELRKPSANAALRSPALARARADLTAAAGALAGAAEADLCGEVVAVEVPLRGVAGRYRRGKLALKSIATGLNGAVDKDKLKLTCEP